MVVRSFSKNKVLEMENLISKITDKYQELIMTSEKDIWISELNEFESEYVKWLKSIGKVFLKKKN